MDRESKQWKVSPTFPSFEISEFGDVRRCKPDKFGNLMGYQLKPYLKRGYRRFAMWHETKQHHIKAARLVIEAFVGLKPFEGAEVCHNDGKKENDHYSNLRWDTHAGNMADKLIHGTNRYGRGRSKLVEEQIIEIRKLLDQGLSRSEVASRYDVGYHGIRYIHAGKTWKDVGIG